MLSNNLFRRKLGPVSPRVLGSFMEPKRFLIWDKEVSPAHRSVLLVDVICLLFAEYQDFSTSNSIEDDKRISSPTDEEFCLRSCDGYHKGESAEPRELYRVA
mmetsp:Transcript_44038/g.108116  ORF Transcript_44038/g.108116 Transcript_44038/m.108116 type:complete len:102 (-) Transcript_44038:42-347(-)